MYAFKCGDVSKNILEGISKSYSKIIKFEEYYNGLLGADYQKECENYIDRSINHQMYLELVKKIYTSSIRWKKVL